MRCYFGSSIAPDSTSRTKPILIPPSQFRMEVLGKSSSISADSTREDPQPRARAGCWRISIGVGGSRALVRRLKSVQPPRCAKIKLRANASVEDFVGLSKTKRGEWSYGIACQFVLEDGSTENLLLIALGQKICRG